MPASVHIADVSLREAVRLVLAHPPKPFAAAWPGLVHADIVTGTPLRTGQLPTPQPHRVCCVAFWEDDASIDAFEASNPVAKTLQGGWSTRLEPLRIHGTWPGIPDDLSKSRKVDHEGPAVVLTLGRTRVSQLPRFLKYSAKAEVAATQAPGLLWGTAMARLGGRPFVGTCSVWESTDAISAYAYGAGADPHPTAIAAGRAKPFHHTEAFIRFHPYALRGGLAARNPMAVDWSTAADPSTQRTD